MYRFRNKKGKEITFSQEELDVYIPMLYVNNIKYRDVSCINIPSNEEADEGYYLIEYNGYKLKE